MATTSASKRRCKKNHAKGFFVVRNDKGMHTRPCTELVKCAATFHAEVHLSYQDSQVNAKSLLGILMLAAAKGSRIIIEAFGDDAEDAVASIVALANNNFHIKY